MSIVHLWLMLCAYCRFSQMLMAFADGISPVQRGTDTVQQDKGGCPGLVEPLALPALLHNLDWSVGGGALDPQQDPAAAYLPEASELLYRDLLRSSGLYLYLRNVHEPSNSPLRYCVFFEHAEPDQDLNFDDGPMEFPRPGLWIPDGNDAAYWWDNCVDLDRDNQRISSPKYGTFVPLCAWMHRVCQLLAAQGVWVAHDLPIVPLVPPHSPFFAHDHEGDDVAAAVDQTFEAAAIHQHLQLRVASVLNHVGYYKETHPPDPHDRFPLAQDERVFQCFVRRLGVTHGGVLPSPYSSSSSSAAFALSGATFAASYSSLTTTPVCTSAWKDSLLDHDHLQFLCRIPAQSTDWLVILLWMVAFERTNYTRWFELQVWVQSIVDMLGTRTAFAALLLARLVDPHGVINCLLQRLICDGNIYSGAVPLQNLHAHWNRWVKLSPGVEAPSWACR